MPLVPVSWWGEKMATSQFLDDFLHTDVDEKATSELVRTLESQLSKTANNDSNLVQKLAPTPQFHGLVKSENSAQQQQTVFNGRNGPVDLNKQNSVFTSLSGTLASAVLSQNSSVFVNSRMPGVLTVSNNIDGNTLKNQIIQQVVNQNGPVNIGGQQLTISQPSSVANMVSSPINIQQQGGIAMIRPGTSGAVTMTTQQTVINQSGMLPAGMQVVNVRPGGPQPVQISQRQLAPRVVLAHQPVIAGGTRPGMPGIPLTALQGLPTSQGQHLLLKTESGQYQLLRVNHTPQPGNAGQQTLQAAPQVSTHNVVVHSHGNQMNAAVPQPVVARSQASSAPAGTGGVGAAPMTAETAKLKCKNFLATLLKLSNEQAEGVSKNVATLIQALIDSRVEPEEFTLRLQKELNSSEQPCLAPFLRKTLPYLRYSLATGDIKIDGLVPPPLSSVPAPPPIVPASPMLRLGPSPAVANSPLIRTVQPTPIQRPSVPVAVRPPVAVQTTTGIPTGSPRPQQQVNRMVTPKGMTPNRNLKAPSQVKNNVKGLDSPMSAPSFAQKNLIVKEKKFSSSGVGLSGDDDINDVATMGGVNLAEESQRILGPTELIGTQIRSVKDETFFPPISLQRKVQEIISRHPGLEEISPDFISLLSHAAQERLKNILERLSVVTEHKMDVLKNEGDYEVGQDVKAQIRFLEDLDKVERRRHDENERERLMKAAKSRSRTEDPEQQAKLKAKAKEMQRAEMEEMRQAEANRTALQAIGQRKKPKLDLNTSGTVSQMPYRPRMKRPTVRELLFVLEEDKETCRSSLLYKAFVK